MSQVGTPRWARWCIGIGTLLLVAGGGGVVAVQATVRTATRSVTRQNLLGAARPPAEREHVEVTGAKNGLTGASAPSHGFELPALTVRQLTGITPDAGAIIDFEGFKDVVEVLGKVCVYVDEDTTSIHFGIALEDWAFAMRGLDPDDLVTLKTNDGRLNPRDVPGVGSVELLSDTSMEMLAAVKADDVETFVLANPSYVSAT